MLGGWSSTIDPIQLADKGASVAGELPLKGMPRLIEMCWDDQGSVNVDLQFIRDPGDGLRAMRGRIVARVGLTCQRCMERLDIELSAEPHLLLLKPGERNDLVERGDALVIEHPVKLSDLVEDELLLEVPMVPMHSADQCRPKSVTAATPGAEKKKDTEANPFSVLERLKHRDH